MTPPSTRLLTLSLLTLAWLATACQNPPEATQATPTQATPTQAAQARSHAYSPFVLKIDSTATPFDTISFKDVGLSISPEDTELLYETLAESLSLELSSAPEAALSSEVIYSSEILNPDNHKACGARHIYVDVWSQESPARWGYSLWSGCGEDSQFAWRELPRHSEDPHPLSQDIATSLRRATSSGCFSKKC